MPFLLRYTEFALVAELVVNCNGAGECFAMMLNFLESSLQNFLEHGPQLAVCYQTSQIGGTRNCS